MRASGTGLRFCAAVAGFGLVALLSAAQTISPDEVRVRSWEYHLPVAPVRVRTIEVQVAAVVRDGKGRVVSGLKPEDFAIYEDGKKQAASGFLVETRQLLEPASGAVTAPVAAPPEVQAQAQTQPRRPRYVALYFDDLHTKSGDMGHVRLASENYVRRGLSVNDRIALFTSSSSETVDFTTDASKVLDALAKLQSHARVFDSGSCPRITPYDAYLIDNHLDPDAYNTALAAAKECHCDESGDYGGDCYRHQEQVVMVQAHQTWEPIREISENTLATIRGVVGYLAKKDGERVLVLASSGFLTGTLERKVTTVVDDALRAGIVINALDAKGLYTEDPSHGQLWEELTGEAGKALILKTKHEAENFGPSLMSETTAMAFLAVGTGGLFFHDRNDLGAGYYSLAAAPETEYLLGFVPEKAKLNGQFHKLRVEVNIPGKFDVQARPAYFAPTKETIEASAPTQEEKIDAEVRGSGEKTDLPATISEKFGTASSGSLQLTIQAHIDIQKLSFGQQKDRHVQKLTFVAALFDPRGNFVTGKRADMDLALKPESFDRFSKTGINGVMELEAQPGNYRLRMVVQEVVHGNISSTNKELQIR